MRYYNGPMHAKAIYFKGKRKPLWDKTVLVTNRFLIVRDDIGSGVALYNLDVVESIYGCKKCTPPHD